MLDLKHGDICICDLSMSMNTPKQSVAPLVFIACDKQDDTNIYVFCKVGKAPRKYSLKPFIDVAASNCLRRNSAVYPTQTVLFSDDLGILSKVGNLSEDEFQKVINIRQQKKEGSAALVMTLCQRCRRDFLADPTSVVKRMDPFSVQETQCDFCQVRNGHTYIVYKRKLYGRNEK